MKKKTYNHDFMRLTKTKHMTSYEGFMIPFRRGQLSKLTIIFFEFTNKSIKYYCINILFCGMELLVSLWFNFIILKQNILVIYPWGRVQRRSDGPVTKTPNPHGNAHQNVNQLST